MVAVDAPSNFELVVMLSILDLPGKAYGANLRRKIEAETEQEVSYGELYSALDHLENGGWLRSVPGEASPMREGRPKKLYHFTVDGLKRFSRTGANIQPLVDSESRDYDDDLDYEGCA